MAIEVHCAGCQKQFSLKDELAGKQVRCPGCGAVITVPEAHALIEADWPETTDHAFRRDRFLLRQKHFSVSEKYIVSDESGQPILYIVRPAHFLRSLLTLLVALVVFLGSIVLGVVIETTLGPGRGIAIVVCLVLGIIATFAAIIVLNPKRHVLVYSDASSQTLVLEILQDQKVHFISATYTVRDPREGVLGCFRKNYIYNFWRKHWDCLAPDGSLLLIAREDSLILSLLRRVLGPFFGLLRTNFIILQPLGDGKEGRIIGEFNRAYSLQDRYVLDMTNDTSRYCDRRLALALGVLLDTGERR